MANLEKMLVDKQLAADMAKAQSAAHAMMNAPGVTKVHRLQVPEAVLQKVASITGLNVAGYLATFDNSKVGHVIGDHGNAAKEAKRKQLPVTLDDFKYEPLIMTAPDLIEASHKTVTGLDAVKFSKVIDGNTYVLVKELRTRRKHLATATMYIKKGVPK